MPIVSVFGGRVRLGWRQYADWLFLDLDCARFPGRLEGADPVYCRSVRGDLSEALRRGVRVYVRTGRVSP